MARSTRQVMEENLFFTGAVSAPVTTLSEKLGLSPIEAYEAEEIPEEELSEESDGSSETAEDDREIDHSVQEEMARLEATFSDRGLKFRMIDRIGEGILFRCALYMSIGDSHTT